VNSEPIAVNGKTLLCSLLSALCSFQINKMNRFLLIRHGSTEALGKSISGRKQGVLLNEEGLRQAQQLVQNLQSLPIHAIYSSPLERAISTALPLAEARNLNIEVDEAFNELDFGEWTDASLEYLQKNPQFDLFNRFRSHFQIPGGEVMINAQSRFLQGLQRIRSKMKDSTIAVFSHSDMIRAALTYYLMMPLDQLLRLEISPASVSIIDVFDDNSRVCLLNGTSAIKL
jgi:broad specificity phosphatase PhoE